MGFQYKGHETLDIKLDLTTEFDHWMSLWMSHLPVASDLDL